MNKSIVLITGANSGVGFATAEVLIKASSVYHVILAARSLQKAETAMVDLKSTGGVKGSLSPVQLDVTDLDSIAHATAYVEKSFGHLDVLINNAAVGARDDDIKTRMLRCMETNVIGPAVVSSAFRSLLLKSLNPYSLYVSSGVGSLTFATDPSSPVYTDLDKGEAYRASKSALNMLAIQEHVQYGKNIKVFAVCPGFVRTNLRGTSEEERSGGGKAKDPKLSGEFILEILKGARDPDVGKFVHREGIYPW
ncbi:MAG: hypothetical protein LQ342_003720 [Letrouitia transgressa]|nr:MAG: hypothetical protein LQ342_003720 [Letrouitia transgressa]